MRTKLIQKLFAHIRTERGFVLPLVLFIITGLVLSITFGVKLYQNEIQMTQSTLEQLKVETMFQKARLRALSDYFSNPESDKLTYDFPDGSVDVFVFNLRENLFKFTMMITTKENKIHYLSYYYEE